ncbi:MAG: hypothetical protein HY931_02545 [Candidatus Falkowbacteria bacterium]|nr:MAG: hypothetical protein HY931_02545 [Candidatus Falkowbacteria bacterium]
MAENNLKSLKWQVPEYHTPERSKSWYIIAFSFIAISLFFCFFTISNWRLEFLGYNGNFLFALILIMAAIITLINESRPPLIVDVEIGPEGVKIGAKFFDYDEIKNFSVLYKPKQSVKSMYLEFKNSMRPRLAIPLRRMDALTVRNYLVRYLDEDLERTNPPLSEQLTKLLKL